MKNILNIISTMGISDLIDILVVAALIYEVLKYVRKTNSYYLARGIIFIFLILLASDVMQLTMINYLIREAFQLGVIALVILFQPEIRRMLERLGSSFTSGKAGQGTETENAIAQTVLACTDMSESKTGALIIFERSVSHKDIPGAGTIINADVTAELLKNIFFNKAPLHDGAVVIRNGRVFAAACVLPLSNNKNISKELGTRHRAGIGISEQTDAVVVIVSEETGAISVAIEGMLKRHLTSQMLDSILRTELMSTEEKKMGFFSKISAALKETSHEEK